MTQKPMSDPPPSPPQSSLYLFYLSLCNQVLIARRSSASSWPQQRTTNEQNWARAHPNAQDLKLSRICDRRKRKNSAEHSYWRGKVSKFSWEVSNFVLIARISRIWALPWKMICKERVVILAATLTFNLLPRLTWFITHYMVFIFIQSIHSIQLDFFFIRALVIVK